jgi:hypothetical protein
MIDLNTRIKHAPPGLVLTDAIAISDTAAIVADSNVGLVLLKSSAHGADAPVVGPVMPSDPVAVGMRIAFSASFTGQNSGDTHKAAWSWGDRCANSTGTVTESNGAGAVRRHGLVRVPARRIRQEQSPRWPRRIQFRLEGDERPAAAIRK